MSGVGLRSRGRWILPVLFGLAAPVSAQQILLDKPVRAGDLVLFPDLNNEMAYYYVPSRPRLATEANGRPQFSFFRWVENVKSASKEPEAREGEGGGIIHALVTIGVTKEQLRDAERELQRIRPGARIEGPVVPKSGTFGIVSTLKDPATGKLAVQVVGVGKAPLLDGDKAAVSIQLTKAGAKVLWEQFQTPTPDISFTFEMDVSGFLAPKRAVIEANLDEVQAHETFAAGLAGTYLAGEIRTAFDDLRRNNVIKITQVGADENFDAIVKAAYEKLFAVLFEKANGTGTPQLEALSTGPSGETGVLDRASKLLNDERVRVGTANTAIQQRNDARRAKQVAAATAEGNVRALERQLQEMQGDAARARQMTEQLQAKANQLAQQASEAEAKGAKDEAAKYRQSGEEAKTRAGQLGADAEKAEGKAATLRADINTARLEASKARAEATGAGEMERERGDPSFALIAAYGLKRTRATGFFSLDLNKYTADTRTFRFDENIGDLRALVGDAAYFRQVNLDDPLYRQREIVAFVDGLDAADFGQYINFVTVRLRKKHEGGEETQDEVRIDRKNFNQEGNNFKLLYGWKGDKSRRRWMDYEYQAVWSFFGGHDVQQPWVATSAGAINLGPPFQRRTVDLQGDPKLLADRGVRSVSVSVFYRLDEQDPAQARQVTLNAATTPLASRIEFIAPKDRLEYDYEMTWRLSGNRTVSSGRKTTSSTILFVDEPPEIR
jgi:hypothetical protein